MEIQEQETASENIVTPEQIFKEPKEEFKPWGMKQRDFLVFLCI